MELQKPEALRSVLVPEQSFTSNLAKLEKLLSKQILISLLIPKPC